MNSTIFFYQRLFYNDDDFWKACKTVCQKSPQSTLIVVPNAIQKGYTGSVLNPPVQNLFTLDELFENPQPSMASFLAAVHSHSWPFSGTLSSYASSMVQVWKSFVSAFQSGAHTPQDKAFSTLYSSWVRLQTHEGATKKREELVSFLNHKSLFFVGMEDILPSQYDDFLFLLKEVTVASVLCHFSAEHSIYEHARRPVEWLESQRSSFSTFREIPLKGGALLPFYPSTEVYQFNDVSEEIEWVIETLLGLKNQMAWESVAIIFPRQPAYTTILFRALIAADIPVSSYTVPLVQTKAFSEALAKVYEGLLPPLSIDEFDLNGLDQIGEIEYQARAILNSDIIPRFESGELPLTPAFFRALCSSFSVSSSIKPGISLYNSTEALVKAKVVFCLGFCEPFWPEPQEDYGSQLYRFFAQMYGVENHVYLTYSQSIREEKTLPSTFLNSLSLQWGTTIPIRQAEPKPVSFPEIVFSPVYKAPEGYETPSTFSITQLEAYQRCPTQYFYKQVLKLPSVDQPKEQVPGSMWGTQIHAILKEFYAQSTPQPLAKTRLEALSQAVLDPLSKHYFAWKVKQQALWDGEDFQGLFSSFLRMIEDEEFPFYVQDVESEFVYSMPGETITIRGRFDAVLNHAEKNWIMIVDYKTGKEIPTRADLQNLRHLQLSFYHLAAKQTYPESSGVGSAVFHLYDGPHVQRRIVTADETLLADMKADLKKIKPLVVDADFEQAFKAHLLFLISCIRDHRFSPHSDDLLPHLKSNRAQTCKTCDYKKICTYEHRFNPF
jgi:RecB family exonuclease